MLIRFKHGDRVIWEHVKKFRSTYRTYKTVGMFIRKVEGINPLGLIWVRIDHNKKPSKIPYYEVDHI